MRVEQKVDQGLTHQDQGPTAGQLHGCASSTWQVLSRTSPLIQGMVMPAHWNGLSLLFWVSEAKRTGAWTLYPRELINPIVQQSTSSAQNTQEETGESKQPELPRMFHRSGMDNLVLSPERNMQTITIALPQVRVQVSCTLPHAMRMEELREFFRGWVDVFREELGDFYQRFETLAENQYVQWRLRQGDTTFPGCTVYVTGSGVGGAKKKVGTKKKKNTNNTQVVVYNGPRRQATKKFKPSRSQPISSNHVMFQLARLSPFNTRAMGARVPGLYAMPTQAFHMKGTVTIQSSTNGKFCIAFLPHPFLSMIRDSGTLTTDGMSVYTNSPDLYSSVTTMYSTAYSSQRLVGGGIRIKNVQAELSAVGNLTVGEFPAQTPNFGLNCVVTYGVDATNAESEVLGEATVSNIFGGLLSRPGSQLFRVSEILRNDVDANFRAMGPSSTDFFATKSSTSFSATRTIGSVIATTAAPTTIVDRDDVSFFKMNGWNAIVIQGTGFPVSTNVLEIEYIYHLEGVPIPTTNAAINIAEAPAVESDPSFLDKVVNAASKLDFVRVVNAISAVTSSSVRSRRGPTHAQLFRGGMLMNGSGDF